MAGLLGRAPGRIRTRGSRLRALTAAATRVRTDAPPNDVKAALGAPQDWQPKCVQASRLIGEIGYVAENYAGSASKVRLFVGAVSDTTDLVDPLPDPTEQATDPIPDAVTPTLPDALVADAKDVLDRLRAWLPDVFRSAFWLLWVIGECFLLGYEAPDENDPEGPPVERWEIRARSELKLTRGRNGGPSQLMLHEPNRKPRPLPADTVVVRIWQRDEEHPALPDSSVRRVLDRCEQMEILDRSINGPATSRFANGGLMIWDKRVIPPGPDATQAQWAATFEQTITTGLTQAVGDPGSASALAPMHAWLDLGNDRKGPEHIKLDREIDEWAVKVRAETLVRIAQGLSCPPERITGYADVNHWGTWAIGDDEWKSHLEPIILLIVSALSTRVLRMLLVTLYGHTTADVALVGFGYDPTRIIARPTRGADALELHAVGELSGDALRESRGFGPADAPSEEERARWLALTRGTIDPYLTTAIIDKVGPLKGLVVDRPVPGTIGQQAQPLPGQAPPAPPAQGPPVEPTRARVIPIRASSAADADGEARRLAGRRLGQRLLEVDRATRARLHGACEAAVRAALARYGAKLTAKARGKPELRAALDGVSEIRAAATLGRPVVQTLAVPAPDESWFDDLGLLAEAILGSAGERTVELLAGYLGTSTHDALTLLEANLRDARGAAVQVLVGRLTALLNARLFTPDHALDPSVVGELDPASLVPVSLLRGVLGLAGGWSGPLTPDGLPVMGADLPVGGLAYGELSRDVLSDAGDSVSGYLWSYGESPRRPFEPHVALDGTEGDSPDDPAFANTEDWPPVENLYPGDHDGCVCDWQPVLSGDALGAYARGALPPDFVPTEGEYVPDEAVSMPPGLEGAPAVPVAASGRPLL